MVVHIVMLIKEVLLEIGHILMDVVCSHRMEKLSIYHQYMI